MLNPTPSNSKTHEERIAANKSDAESLTLRGLFECEEGSLLRYAFSLTGRRVVAEEIVQEVFLQLHANWDQVDAPRAWLYRSVRNRGLNYLRKSKRETLQCDDEQAVQSMDGINETPEAVMARMETTVLLRQLLGQLPENDHRLIRLKYFEGLKYREISDRTGLSIGNVGYRLHHIMQQLANQLRPLGIDESK